MADALLTYHPARRCITAISRAHRIVQHYATAAAKEAKHRPWDRDCADLAQCLREAADMLADIPHESSLEWIADQLDPGCLMDGSRTSMQIAVEQIAMERSAAE